MEHFNAEELTTSGATTIWSFTQATNWNVIKDEISASQTTRNESFILLGPSSGERENF